MSRVHKVARRALGGLAVGAIVLFAASGCAPGTVYVGVSGPGPWVGYPPGYYPPPGIYGRPWGYQPDEDAQEPVEPQTVPVPPEDPDEDGSRTPETSSEG